MKFLTALTILFFSQNSFSMSADQIMELVDQRNDGDNIVMEIEMTLVDKNGHERVRKMRSFTKDDGKDTMRMQFFLQPADVKDTAFLTYDYYTGDKDDDQWMYLPELKKTKRIASSDKSSAFMGSDFSYSDMNRRVLKEWKYELLKEMEFDGKKLWSVQATPINKDVETKYGYTKSVIFIRQDIHLPVRAMHFVKDGNLVKYMEVKSLKEVNGVWFSTETKMKTTKEKTKLHETILKWNDIKTDQNLKKDSFSVRYIEKGL